MDFDRAEKGLLFLMEEQDIPKDGETYLDGMGWLRELREIVEAERRFVTISTDMCHRKRRVLRELDRLSLRLAGTGFGDPSHEHGEGASYRHRRDDYAHEHSKMHLASCCCLDDGAGSMEVLLRAA